MSNIKTLPMEEVLKRLDKIHPCLSFPKINSEYSNTQSRVTVLCSVHGEYLSTIENLIYSKAGCKKCRDLKTKNKYLKAVVEYPIISHILKKYKLADSLTKVNSITPIEFICDIHGSFFRTIKSLNRYNKESVPACEKCSRVSLFIKSKEYYESEMKLKYKNKYSYLFPKDFKGAHTRIVIECPKHGQWDCLIYNHLHNNTECPKCSKVISKGSIEVLNYLVSLGITAKPEVRKENIKVDIVIEDKKIAIEYLGGYFHSTKFIKDKNFHKNRRLFLNSIGYRTIFIWEHEWIYNNAKVKDYLKAQLGFFNKVFARKCKIVEVDKKTGKSFIEKNHLMGSGLTCSTYIGLEFEGELLACVGFRKVFKNYELYRAAYLKNYRVIGALSKILTYLIKNKSPEKIISYVDLDKFEGVSYLKSGFKIVGESLSMFYFKRDMPISRHKLKKSELLKNTPILNPLLTEKELCESLQIYQCWNSGTMKVELTKSL
jgi:hypothetical protein